MPQKRKKKADPMQKRLRDEKKRKRLHKLLNKLTRGDRITKPLLENEVSAELEKESTGVRVRSDVQDTEEVREHRALMLKDWARYSHDRWRKDIKQHDQVLSSRLRALNALRDANFDLYAKAIQPDLALLHFKAQGPTATPPPHDVQSFEDKYMVDGHYEDTTREYKVHYNNTRDFVKELMAEEHRKKAAIKAAKRAAKEEAGL